MKKLLVALMLLLALAPIFAGGASEGPEEGQTEIFFFHRWPNDPKNSMFNELLAQYMEENPDVYISMDCILNDQYKERIRMIVPTEDVPDVFSSWSGTFAQEMVASGNVLALNDIYEADPEWSEKLAAASVAGFTFDGTIYGIPWSQDGKVFFYNEKIFNELGLEEPKTWGEFIELLDTLKANGYETPVAEGLVDQWAVLHYLGTINQRMIDEETLAKDYDAATGEFTDPGYVRALEYWQQLTALFTLPASLGMGDMAQANAILKKAEERARILVSESEIVKTAQQRAAEIVSQAQSEARTVRQTVTDYCETMLKNTEEVMAANAAQVKNVRANLRQTAKKSGQ